MTDVTETAAIKPGSWRDLLGRERLGTATLLAGGVGLYATNEFLTISLLPSTVADIGGQRFYAWVIAVYLVGSVVAAAAVNPLLVRFGPRASYLLTLAVFGVGTLGCALAPNMELLLVGRTVQGAAGGMLAGLGYAVINAALPNWLWTRASALVSAMWGVSVIIGPAMGGIFAQFGIWRWAFGSLVILTVAMAALVPGALPARQQSDRAGRRSRGFRCGRCCCSAPPRWRSASRECSEPPLPHSASSPSARCWSRCSWSSTVVPRRRCCRGRRSGPGR